MNQELSAALPSLVPRPPRSDPRGPKRRLVGAAMGSSWKIGTLAGIPLQVHPTFALLLAWVAVSHVLAGHGLRGVMGGLFLIVSIFACIVLHELSHALVARRFGVQTRHITLLPIGGVARLERMPEKATQELSVAIAGPITSYAIAGALFAVQLLLGGPVGLEPLQVVGGPFLTNLMWINVGLATFNLLPAFPMDGGRVLRALLALRLGRGRATEVAARVGQAMAVAFGVFGLLFNPFLVLIALFVWFGAKGEASLVELKDRLSGLPVMQAMIRDFRVLAPDELLARAVELTLGGFQQDFPVVAGNRVVGVLTHANIVKGLAEGGRELPVSAVMDQRFEVAGPWEMLDVAFERLENCECRALVVVHDGELVGLLTPESIGEMLTLEKAFRRSGERPQ